MAEMEVESQTTPSPTEEWLVKAVLKDSSRIHNSGVAGVQIISITKLT